MLKMNKGLSVPTELKLQLKTKEEYEQSKPVVHKYGKKEQVCITDGVGFETPRGRNPLEIVLDASEGFVPLWKKGTVLRWEFDESSLGMFKNASEMKDYVRKLFAEALLKWDDAVPVSFSENSKSWDFQLRIEDSDKCSPSGCTLASAFFPDTGRHKLHLYPKMFNESTKEQVDTMIHELGHVFGLRHFFAKVREKKWTSEIFGTHEAFSIMNYGYKSELTDNDKSDLKKLYELAWSGKLTDINGTPIKFMIPYHNTVSLLAQAVSINVFH